MYIVCVSGVKQIDIFSGSRIIDRHIVEDAVETLFTIYDPHNTKRLSINEMYKILKVEESIFSNVRIIVYKGYSLIMIEKYCRIADEFSTIISLC